MCIARIGYRRRAGWIFGLFLIFVFFFFVGFLRLYSTWYFFQQQYLKGHIISVAVCLINRRVCRPSCMRARGRVIWWCVDTTAGVGRTPNTRPAEHIARSQLPVSPDGENLSSTCPACWSHVLPHTRVISRTFVHTDVPCSLNTSS